MLPNVSSLTQSLLFADDTNIFCSHKDANHLVSIVNNVKNCLEGQAPSYFSDYFRRRTYDIHDYDTWSKDRISIDKVNLELTKRAFFYEGATLFNDFM